MVVAKGNRKGCEKDASGQSIMKYGTIFHGCAGKRDRNIFYEARGDKATWRFADFCYLFIYLYVFFLCLRVYALTYLHICMCQLFLRMDIGGEGMNFFISSLRTTTGLYNDKTSIKWMGIRLDRFQRRIRPQG